MDKEIEASLLSFYIIAITRGLHYLTSLTLLFLLTSFDFGVMAVVMAVMALMNSVSAFGIDSALISFQGNEEPLLNDAWSLELLKGVFLTIFVLLLAPNVAVWLEQPILKNLLSVMSLAFIFQSSKNIGLVSLRKRFDFGIIFRCEIGMAVSSSILTVSAAYYFASPWAIALGYLGGWMTYVFLSYLLCPYRPKISLERAKIKYLMNYSKWILFSAQINSFVENGINIFVGSHFGMAVLGQFERADMFTRKTVLQIGEVIWKVGLPSLSIRGGDLTALRDRYILLYRFICWLVFPAMALVYIYMPFIVNLREDSGWEHFESLVLILSFVAIITILSTPASILFQAIRRPEVGFKIAYIRLFTTAAILFPLIKYFEQSGVAYTLLGGALVTFPFSIYNVKKIISISFSKHFFIAMEYLIPCCIFFLLNPGNRSLLMELLLILSALVGYIIVLCMVSKDSYSRVKLLILKIRVFIS